MKKSLTKIVQEKISPKNIELTSFGWQRIRAIEREIEAGKISVEDIINKLQSEDKLKFKLDKDDWKEIQKEIEKNIR